MPQKKLPDVNLRIGDIVSYQGNVFTIVDQALDIHPITKEVTVLFSIVPDGTRITPMQAAKLAEILDYSPRVIKVYRELREINGGRVNLKLPWDEYKGNLTYNPTLRRWEIFDKAVFSFHFVADDIARIEHEKGKLKTLVFMEDFKI